MTIQRYTQEFHYITEEIIDKADPAGGIMYAEDVITEIARLEGIIEDYAAEERDRAQNEP